ncbi:GntR family transcriptional regulator [Ruania halotolerans]|uniref:GntR family transcriptional regulator n=1 Tax=Ruania halotolerans TaxID=2897773 RepID=UPI001E41CD95|nr:GntR family transcriptional regulator [Ruania halotolerans]UFU07432.1 GntR family transcriptional regulator [Ruania halotolerans]
MQVRIDDGDPTPPYEQLRRQLLALMHAGALAPEARLPPIRQLAADLGVAAGTVARAYRELEDAGWLVSRRGGGTRVATGAAPQSAASGVDLSEVTAAVHHARARGATATQIQATVDLALAAGPQ